MRRLRYADVAATVALVLSMSGTAYAVTKVGTSDIQNRAVTTAKLADKAVTHAKVARNAITGKNVAKDSLRLSDISGADASGVISFSLAAHSCGYLSLGVSGAKVGQVALLSWTGTTDPPQGVVFGPLQVVQAGLVKTSACNLTDDAISQSDVGVRMITLD